MVVLILLGCLWAAVLELNKNTLWGWLLSLGLFIAFAVLKKGFLAERSWLLRAGGWALLLAAAMLVLSGCSSVMRPPSATAFMSSYEKDDAVVNMSLALYGGNLDYPSSSSINLVDIYL